MTIHLGLGLLLPVNLLVTCLTVTLETVSGWTINRKVILVTSDIYNWLKKGDTRSEEGAEEQTSPLAEHTQLVLGWAPRRVSGLRGGGTPGWGEWGKPRCFNHFLKSKHWVK